MTLPSKPDLHWTDPGIKEFNSDGTVSLRPTPPTVPEAGPQPVEGITTIDSPTRCGNCWHPYEQHTGRSLRPGDMERLPNSRLGPIQARPGAGCEASAYPRSTREDWHHTCPCGTYRPEPSR